MGRLPGLDLGDHRFEDIEDIQAGKPSGIQELRVERAVEFTCDALNLREIAPVPDGLGSPAYHLLCKPDGLLIVGEVRDGGVEPTEVVGVAQGLHLVPDLHLHIRPDRFVGQLAGFDLKRKRLQDLNVERGYLAVAVELRDAGCFVDASAESVARHVR